MWLVAGGGAEAGGGLWRVCVDHSRLSCCGVECLWRVRVCGGVCVSAAEDAPCDRRRCGDEAMAGRRDGMLSACALSAERLLTAVYRTLYVRRVCVACRWACWSRDVFVCAGWCDVMCPSCCCRLR